jgi:RNA polymerase sigma factor (TIGR02999 family)
MTREQGARDVSDLLLAWSDGDPAARDRLISLVYVELHRTARHYMRRERPAHTLQASGLVNEVYLRLVKLNRIRWQNRTHFYGIAAQLMRQILVDHARARVYRKRGGGRRRVAMDAVPGAPGDQLDLVAVDEALQALGALDRRKSRVVEMRLFGGFSVEETAAALNVSPETVMRDWKFSKAWLAERLRAATGHDE